MSACGLSTRLLTGPLGLGFISVVHRRPFFHHILRLSPHFPLALPKGFADLCTSFLGHPHYHPLHTPVTKVYAVISQKTSKMVHAP